ncbi:hypothetical protein PHAVU_008G089800 [Phaseolus vulgaris]|uniref:Uncharacterized protein n=1 Tax=Phaseolus vulgaris TaxID=3885 RepID=V7B3Q1_PHAVU|nr:hypothetical protein PHAVU_008G089800g [Phaseolus vulgaris]ESW12165.1 hypothetical protein PHAVU_008G089800g [Phaseolus vulgaris]
MSSEETNVTRKGSRKRRDHSDDACRSPSSPPPPPCVTVTEKETMVKGNNNHNSNNEIHVLMSSDAQYCYYMLEAMPQPGPTWSTAGPCVLAEPTPRPTPSPTPTPTPTLTPSPTPPFEANQDSSCTWWLEGLDDSMTTEKLDIPFEENVVMENCEGLGYESTLVDAIDLSYCCPDDWLVIPAMDQDFGDLLMP